MTYPPPEAAPVPDDTPVDNVPVDELPPYDEPSRWPVVLVVVVVVVAVVVALMLARTAVRALWHALVGGPPSDGVIMFPAASDPYSGPVYRVWFYDGDHRQLADRRLSAALPQVYGPTADAALDRLARQLAVEVEARDGQRCFHPRVVLFDTAGRTVRSWSVAW